MNLPKIIMIGIIYLCTILVSIQTNFHIFNDLKLFGVQIVSPKPELNFPSFIKGTYQKKYELRHQELIGFKGYFAKTENQLNYSIFNELSGTNAVLGLEKNIYEKGYIDSFNKFNLMDHSQLENIVLRMKRLQSILSKLNICFIVLISSSKAEALKEYIPKRFISRLHYMNKSNYQMLLPLFEKHGINYIDGPAILSDLKKQSQLPLFASSAIHWNSYAAYHVTSSLLNKMERLMQRQLVKIKMKKIQSSKYPKYVEHDMLLAANLLDPESLLADAYVYLATTSTMKEKCYLPSMLFIGGSFVDTIIRYLSRHGCYSRCSHWAYYSNEITYPVFNKNKLRGKNIVWDQSVEYDYLLCDSYTVSKFNHPVDQATNLISIPVGKLLRNKVFVEYNKQNFYNMSSVSTESPLCLMEIKTKKLNSKQIQWSTEVFNRDAIVIEVNEEVISNIGCGFIEDALEALQ